MLINCHCCKIIQSAERMITCYIPSCKQSFCINCVKKKYVMGANKFCVSHNAKFKEKWKCFKCRHMCKCLKCRGLDGDGDGDQKNNQGFLRKKKRRELTKTPPRIKIKKRKNKNPQKKKFRHHKKSNPEIVHEITTNNVILGNEIFSNVITLDNYVIIECFDDFQQEEETIHPHEGQNQGNVENDEEKCKEIPKLQEINENPEKICIEEDINNHSICKINNQNDKAQDQASSITKSTASDLNSLICESAKTSKCHNNSKPRKRTNKPCILCNQFQLSDNIEMIKFYTYDEFLTCMSLFFCKVLERQNVLSQIERYFKNIVGNKAYFEKMLQIKYPLMKDKRLKCPKRICSKCILVRLKMENGIQSLFDCLDDEDEQVNLDPRKKAEIENNLKYLILKENKHNIRILNEFSDKNDNEQNGSNERDSSNIFNKIFERKIIFFSRAKNELNNRKTFEKHIYIDFKKSAFGQKISKPFLSKISESTTKEKNNKLFSSGGVSNFLGGLSDNDTKPNNEGSKEERDMNNMNTKIISSLEKVRLVMGMSQCQNLLIQDILRRVETYISESKEIVDEWNKQIKELIILASKIKMSYCESENFQFLGASTTTYQACIGHLAFFLEEIQRNNIQLNTIPYTLNALLNRREESTEKVNKDL